MIAVAVKSEGGSSSSGGGLYNCCSQPCSKKHSTVRPAAAHCATRRSLCTPCTMGARAARLPGDSSSRQGSKREKGSDRGRKKNERGSEGGEEVECEVQEKDVWKERVGEGWGRTDKELWEEREGELVKVRCCRVR